MYFWVALGGALGSMARYWMGIRITVLAGLAFPWATILINILGSLVIGFLATFTGPEGRLPAPSVTGLPRFSAEHERVQVFSTFHIRYGGAWMTPFRFL